jgi:hypothetical protein
VIGKHDRDVFAFVFAALVTRLMRQSGQAIPEPTRESCSCCVLQDRWWKSQNVRLLVACEMGVLQESNKSAVAAYGTVLEGALSLKI